MSIDAGTINSSIQIGIASLKSQVVVASTQFKKLEDTSVKSMNTIKTSSIVAWALISKAITSTIKVAADFEQSMANAQSVARGTISEFKDLRDAAIDAASSTTYTATQAADVLYILASAGLSATQSAQALNGVLTLAAATQTGLTEVSETVVSTLKQYNLTAADSTKVANVFAAAIGDSLATMDKLNTSMSYAGPIAAAFGQTLEGTVASLEALYDSGYKAEQAGTGVRYALAAISSESMSTSKKLIDLGYDFSQFNTLTNTIAESFGYLSNAGLNAGEAMAAFGRRSGGQALVLMKAGQEGIEEYQKAITDTTEAEDMYGIQTDTLQGNLKRLKASLQNASIALNEDLLPSLKIGTTLAKKLTDAFIELPAKQRLFISTMAAGVVVGTVFLGISALITVALKAIGTAALVASGWVGLAAASIVELVSVGKILSDNHLEKTFGDIADSMHITVQEARDLSKIGGFLNTSIEGAKELQTDLKKTSDEMKDFAIDIKKLTGQINWKEFWGMSDEDMADFIQNFANEQGVAASLVVSVLEGNEKLAESYSDVFDIIKKEAIEEDNRRKDSIARGTDAARAAAAEKVLEEEKLKDINLMNDALIEYGATEAEINRKKELGVLSEQEANKELLSAKEKYLDSLVEIGTLSDDVAAEQKKIADEVIQLGGDIDATTAKIAASEAATATAEATAARLAASTENYNSKTEMLNDTLSSSIEKQRQEAVALVEVGEGHSDNVKAINAYYEALEKLDRGTQLDALQDKINNLTLGEVTLLEKQREAALAELELRGVSEEGVQDLIDKTNEYYDLLEKDVTDSGIVAAQEKIDGLTLSTIELIEQERYQANLEEVNSGKSDLQKREAIRLNNLYYDSLVNNAKIDEFKEKLSEITTAISGVSDVFQSLSALTSSMFDAMISNLEAEEEAMLKKAGVQDETAIESAQIGVTEAEKVKKAALDAIQEQLDAAILAGDTEAEAALKNDLEEEKSTQKGLVQKAKDAVTKAEIEADYAEKIKEIEYKQAMWAWNLKLLTGAADVASAIIEAMPNPWLMGLAATSGALQMGAIAMAKPQMATGGIVFPQSKGVETIQAENGYPEVDFNMGPSGSAVMEDLADRLANKINGSSGTLKIVIPLDGKIVASAVVKYINDGIVRLDK